jgi:probable rRNA maturation factor
MNPAPSVEVLNHQDAVALGAMPGLLEKSAPAAAGAAWLARTGDDAPLGGLRQIDVALVDDAAIAGVHGQFLGDPTPTDVITFDHGEILVGVETAARQAAEHGEPLGRELLRYLVHGLLHLAGHDDHEESARRCMHGEQERIVGELWISGPWADGG